MTDQADRPVRWKESATTLPNGSGQRPKYQKDNRSVLRVGENRRPVPTFVISQIPPGGCPISRVLCARSGAFDFPVMILSTRKMCVCSARHRGDEMRGQTRRYTSFAPGAESHLDVIPVLAIFVKTADPCQGESSTGRKQATRPKCLRLKILPLSH